jgi:hypothetical protein
MFHIDTFRANPQPFYSFAKVGYLLLALLFITRFPDTHFKYKLETNVVSSLHQTFGTKRKAFTELYSEY